jgi:hypothetical protein
VYETYSGEAALQAKQVNESPLLPASGERELLFANTHPGLPGNQPQGRKEREEPAPPPTHQKKGRSHACPFSFGPNWSQRASAGFAASFSA